MKVKIRHFASLKQEAGQGPLTVNLSAGATVADLMSKLGINSNEIGILIVSGKQAIFEQELKENDLVTLIPHIGGG